MPQTFFLNFPYLRKYDLIRLILYLWQPCISQFCDITQDRFCNNFRKLKHAMFDKEVIV